MPSTAMRRTPERRARISSLVVSSRAGPRSMTGSTPRNGPSESAFRRGSGRDVRLRGAFSQIAVEKRDSPSDDFVGPHLEALEEARPEGRADGHVRGVPPSSKKHSSNSRRVVASIESVPPASQKCFEPARKVHRRVRCRHANVPQISRAVARRDIHATAERNREVSKVTADTRSLLIDLPGRLGRPREAVSKLDVMMDEVADGLDASPSGRTIGKELPSDRRKEIRFAVTTREKKSKRILR